jgi:hypothetical protein
MQQQQQVLVGPDCQQQQQQQQAVVHLQRKRICQLAPTPCLLIYPAGS